MTVDSRPSALFRYSLPVVSVALAIGIATLMARTIGPTPATNFAFLFAILASSWIGGYVPGLIACTLSVFLGPLAIVPAFTFAKVDWYRYVLVMLFSLLVSYIGAQRRKTEASLRAMNMELDERVRERTCELNEALAALREREERQRRAVEAGKVGLWEWDIDKNEVTWSEQVNELHGIPVGSFGGTVEAFSAMVNPHDRSHLSSAISKTLAGAAPYQVEYRPVRPDGQHRWLSASGRVTFDAQGKAVFMHGAVVDVTERRDAEDGLKRTNAELEEFASVASHDLQEPLRQVAIFSQLVQQKYANQIDAEADEYLNYCVSGARRMRDLIDDLLTYSRTARADHLPPHVVDLNDVLAQVSETLTTRVKECGATLDIATLPKIKGHAAMLNQLWQNLLANALRYRGEAAPRIRVTADQHNGYWTFAVADNGIGISPEYHEQIFRIFQRLHDRETYPGTGIGLAICKKIVERHGGRIWVESEPGHGATFRFTLAA